MSVCFGGFTRITEGIRKPNKAWDIGFLLCQWEKYRIRTVTHLEIKKPGIEVAAKKILAICIDAYTNPGKS